MGTGRGKVILRHLSPTSQQSSDLTLTSPDLLRIYNTGPQRLNFFALFVSDTNIFLQQQPYLFPCLNLLIFLPHLHSHTCRPYLYLCLQQYCLWLDLTKQSVAQFYHQKKDQEFTKSHFSSTAVSHHKYWNAVNTREKLKSKIHNLVLERIQL